MKKKNEELDLVAGLSVLVLLLSAGAEILDSIDKKAKQEKSRSFIAPDGELKLKPSFWDYFREKK